MQKTPNISKLGRVYVDSEGFMYRIIDYNVNYLVLDETGTGWECSKKEIDSFYDTLMPSGIMSINLVNFGYNGDQDVIVSFYRTADLSNGIERPFIIGRQSIINFLAAQFATDFNDIPYGLCISRLSSPSNFDMDVMLECNNIVESKIICLYPFDTITSIQELSIPTNKFDSVINNFRVNFDPKGVKTVGSTLYQFLDNTGWQSEFNMSHGIVILDDNVFEYEEKNQLLYPQTNESPQYNLRNLTNALEHQLNHRVTVLDAVEYNPRYDLRRLGYDAFILVRNYNDSNKVFIVKYVRGDQVIFVPKSQKLIASQLMNKLGLQI